MLGLVCVCVCICSTTRLLRPLSGCYICSSTTASAARFCCCRPLLTSPPTTVRASLSNATPVSIATAPQLCLYPNDWNRQTSRQPSFGCPEIRHPALNDRCLLRLNFTSCLLSLLLLNSSDERLLLLVQVPRCGAS